MARELEAAGLQLEESTYRGTAESCGRLRGWPPCMLNGDRDEKLRPLRHSSAQTKTPPRFPEAAFSYSYIERGRFLVLGRPGSDLLSQGLSHSTIGAEAFNGRVRDGIGLRRFAKTTRPAKDKKTKQAIFVWRLAPLIHSGLDLAILWTLKMRAIKPIERLVPVSCMHYCTSTSGLSTWWSSTVLKGMLVLRWVSRLDAFSGYPVRT